MINSESPGLKLIQTILENQIVLMQAAWIEWRRGAGAEEAMQWIENTLDAQDSFQSPMGYLLKSTLTSIESNNDGR